MGTAAELEEGLGVELRHLRPWVGAVAAELGAFGFVGFGLIETP